MYLPPPSSGKATVLPKHQGVNFYADPTACMRLVIAQCEQIEYFESDPENKTCRCVKRIAGITASKKSSAGRQSILYSVDCTGRSPLVHHPPFASFV